MSALSSNTVGENPSFLSAEHFKNLCEGKKIILHESIRIDYPEGWSRIVEDFLLEVGDLRITIYSVESFEQLLRVEFLHKSQQSGLKIFSAVNHAMIRSRSACFECGNQVVYKENIGRFDLCPACRLMAAKKGKTGTWLDKFV